MTVNLTKSEALIRFEFFNGEELVLSKLVAGQILNSIETGDRLQLEDFVAHALQLHTDSIDQRAGIRLPPTVAKWDIQLLRHEFAHLHMPDDGDRADHSLPARSIQRIERCRSMLSVANRILPTRAREEAFDEWMDDLETTAENELPVFRRAAWILLRALPSAALRSRLPSRIRGRES